MAGERISGNPIAPANRAGRRLRSQCAPSMVAPATGEAYGQEKRMIENIVGFAVLVVVLAVLIFSLFRWLRGEVAKLKAEVKNLRADVKEFRDDIVELRERMARLEGAMDSLRAAVNETGARPSGTASPRR